MNDDDNLNSDQDDEFKLDDTDVVPDDMTDFSFDDDEDEDPDKDH